MRRPSVDTLGGAAFGACAGCSFGAGVLLASHPLAALAYACAAVAAAAAVAWAWRRTGAGEDGPPWLQR